MPRTGNSPFTGIRIFGTASFLKIHFTLTIKYTNPDASMDQIFIPVYLSPCCLPDNFIVFINNVKEFILIVSYFHLFFMHLLIAPFLQVPMPFLLILFPKKDLFLYKK